MMSSERTGIETATVALVSLDIAGHVYQFPVHDSMKILVGRGNSAHPPTNGVVLDLIGVGSEDSGVSRRHAIVRVQGSETYLVDLGSTNGTFLNGRKVEAHKQHLLYSGDRIHFGRLETRIMLE
ncbi:MAG: FHA domain-containing protein [Anaerolineae bacterium]|nr:FHA domain-containing protein [Anaerolineae bacterium]